MNDEDDLPEMNEEHVHGDNCNHDNEGHKASLDDLDEEASK